MVNFGRQERGQRSRDTTPKLDLEAWLVEASFSSVGLGRSSRLSSETD